MRTDCYNLARSGQARWLSQVSSVAQIFSLLYRRIAFGNPPHRPSRDWQLRSPGRLQTCDTADCKSALRVRHAPAFHPKCCPAYLAGLVFTLTCAQALAALEVVSTDEIQSVFGEAGQRIQVVFHNPGRATAQADLRTRLYQTTAATTVLMDEGTWKPLQVLPGQTVIETASLDFPSVRAPSDFLIQWLDGTNRALGRTQVRVFPTNLLADLKPLAGDRPIGVLDPQDQIKPLLKQFAVDFEDLEAAAVSSFSGTLAILGPFVSRAQMPEGLADRVAALARKGCAVVWLLPPLDRERKLKPDFFTVPFGEGLVVVAQARLVANLATNPAAQHNLIQLAESAVRREPWRLPGQNP